MSTECTDKIIDGIRKRRKAVGSRPWKYNSKHEMFIGTTNALEMYEDVLNLGRDGKEWFEYKDENMRGGWKLTNASVKRMARIKALGEFLERCREDIDYLLSRESQLCESIARILYNCRDADCGDHCSNSCMFCQARDALHGSVAQSAEQAAHNRGVSGSIPDGATKHESWCLINKPDCGPVHCTCGVLRCANCQHPRDRHVGLTVCKVFACACEKFKGTE